MRILFHGKNKTCNFQCGFILLRNLLVMFVVIICFAAILVSTAIVSQQVSRYMENVQTEITERNEIIRQKVNR